jgi:hypothetical protein
VAEGAPQAAAVASAAARIQVSVRGWQMPGNTALCKHEEALGAHRALQEPAMYCPALHEQSLCAEPLSSLQGFEVSSMWSSSRNHPKESRERKIDSAKQTWFSVRNS